MPEKFVLGFCGNLFNFFHFPLSWGFLIGNAPLKSYYFDFLGPFHFFSYKLYNSLQHIIFQKKLNFFSRILIDLFSWSIKNKFWKWIVNLNSYLIMLMGLNHRKKELKYLNTLGTKSLITESYFYRNRILQKMHIRNGGMILKGRYFFLMELRILAV